MANDGPIDAVITWVNGDDPAHRAKRHEWYEHEFGEEPTGGDGRYRESGEFAWCVASLLTNMPWLRSVIIVSDQQVPDFLRELGADLSRRVRVVDHAVIFEGYEQYLPTFNNRSLLPMLWRIPGLSDRFIYLNDDFVVTRPVAPDSFFQSDHSVIRGRWEPNTVGLRGGLGLKRTSRPGNHHAQALAAVQAGYRWRYLRVPHEPHALFRSDLETYFTQRPGELAELVSHRFRHADQYLADALGQHLALRRGAARVLPPRRHLRLRDRDYDSVRLVNHLDRIQKDDRLCFLCLPGLEAVDEPGRQAIFNTLKQMLGDPNAIFRNALGEGR